MTYITRRIGWSNMKDTPNDQLPGQTWFTEYHTGNAGLTLRISCHLARRQSPFQLIEIFNSVEYGRMLTLDGLVMLTERDEYVYHEMMVHIPLLIHPDPKRVLVVGGGDGGCLREIVKHACVEKAVEVEIDRDVVELCKEHFPSIASAYDNPKVELVIGDAIDYLQNVSGQYDVAVIDGSDPVGPAEGLFKRSFFQNIADSLKPGGIMSCQLGSPFYSLDRIRETVAHWRGIFADARIYLAHIPTYPSGVWAFGVASKEVDGTSKNPDRVRYLTFAAGLKYYNLDTHQGAFSLPERVRRAAMGESDV